MQLVLFSPSTCHSFISGPHILLYTLFSNTTYVHHSELVSKFRTLRKQPVKLHVYVSPSVFGSGEGMLNILNLMEVSNPGVTRWKKLINMP
jgi:hypothetical protein